MFGDTPVTFEDVEAWLDHIPRMLGSTTKRRYTYARQWDVINKIKHAKQCGWWYLPKIEPDALPPRLCDLLLEINATGRF